MDLERFTIAVYGLIDELLAALHADPDRRRERQRDPAPMLADAEVLTKGGVSEFLGHDQDVAIDLSFRRDHPDWFPALKWLHCTTSVRQAANLSVVKEQRWGRLLDRLAHDPTLSCVDS